MIIKSLKLNNIQLFHDQKVEFGRLNIATGINHDNPSDSSNGCGKTTLVMTSPIFILYGELDKITLKDLISFDESISSGEIEIQHNGHLYKIIRKIPSELEIYEDGVEIKRNTIPLKQQYINEIFGDYKFFQQFRVIDLEKGINLLELGSISLKKLMMGFIEDEYNTFRKTLLDEKNHREQFSVSKKLYTFSLSIKRLETLESGLKKLEADKQEQCSSISEQTKLVNNMQSEIQVLNSRIDDCNGKMEQNKVDIEMLNYSIKETQNKIKELENTPKKEIKEIDYTEKIKAKTEESKNQELKLEELQQENTSLRKKYSNLENKNDNLILKSNELEDKLEELEKILDNLKNSKFNEKCKYCGAVVTEENVDIFKKENQDKINKTKIEIKKISGLLFEISPKLKELDEYIIKNINESTITRGKYNQVLLEINSLNELQLNQIKEIASLEKEEELKKANIDKYKEIFSKDNQQLNSMNNEILSNEIEQMSQKMIQLKETIISEQDYLTNLETINKRINYKIEKTKEYIMKLKEAFKFKEYSFTKKDVELYDEAIKILDSYAGIYIQEWLGSLQTIMNSLLKKINLNIEFSPEKDFLKIKDNEREVKYNLLSGGQKTFLSAVFKLSILLHKGLEGTLLIDEGLGRMDKINLQNFLEVCKDLPFQIIGIYQNYDLEDESINKIIIERKEGTSYVKK